MKLGAYLGQIKTQVDDLDLIPPIALLDQRAYEHNVELLFEHFSKIPGLRMRIASKSLRCGRLIKDLLDRDPNSDLLSGVMSFRVTEANHLVESYGVRDVLVAYPIASKAEARLQAETEAKVAEVGGAASIVVDCREHVDLLAEAGEARGVEIPICVDLDLSYTPAGKKGPHIGTRRSPIADAAAVVSLARYIRDSKGVRMHGLMGYEGHHAALPDSKPYEKLFKRVSWPQIEHRRESIGKEFERAGFRDLPLLNGGGSGSYLSTSTSKWVNEVAVGSGLYKSALFDNHEQLKPFQPSLYYALRAVRIPGPGWVTAYGGGYYASTGGMPPVIDTPEGFKPTKSEGFGEVQTPIREPDGKLRLGDLVLCRASKAGEPLERFNQIYPVKDGIIAEPILTYRGEGENFG